MSDPALSVPSSPSLPGPEFQELWFIMARRRWHSLVLVPADNSGATGAVALALAEVGRWVGEDPVTYVMKDTVDYASGLQVVARAAPALPEDGARPGPAGRVIISVRPVTVEPLGLALTQAADAVIVCVELGKTRLSAARRTIELIGRERIAGCFLVT